LLKVVKFVDLTVRDGQQSLLATRLRTDDIVRIVEVLDKAGFYALEVWGGATFDAPLRYLREDPWERLKRIRENVRRTKLMMLLRGMNLVGYRHYPKDVVEEFIKYAHRDGIDVFRVFDALNDPDNLSYPIKIINEVGAELQVCIVYTISPIHTVSYYRKLAEEFVSRFEPKTVTIKDMAGILAPYPAVELVKELKDLGVEVDVHSHTTSGLAPMSLLKSIEAGADIVDVTISSMSLYTSHTPAESLAAALKDTPYDPKLNMEPLYKAAELTWEIRKKYSEYDYALKKPPIDVRVIKHQIPGGMLSNLIAQLRELKAEDKLQEVLEEVVNVRRDLSWPPLVTPISQIVGAQAVLNVIMGRYKAVTKELLDYVEGKYGRPPGPVNPELIKMAKERPEEERVEQHMTTLSEAIEKLPRHLARKAEDYLTYALFPDIAIEALEEIYQRS
jgi:pyruvate carboxylase subunit B